MDEEARQNERVKKYQITIAQSMQLGTDIQQVLGNEKITDWVTREWLYICALDGMSAEQLTSMIENKRNLLQIKKERLDYLRERLTRTDILKRELEALKLEVRQACNETRYQRKYLNAV